MLAKVMTLTDHGFRPVAVFVCFACLGVVKKKSAGFALEGQISTVYTEGVSLLQRLVSQAACSDGQEGPCFFVLFVCLFLHDISMISSKLRSCVKVEVVVLGSLSPYGLC